MSKFLKDDAYRMEPGDFLEFGPFRADTHRRVLLRGDEVVPLPTKAFDVLVALLQNPGETVTRDQIMTRVWPGSFVEEGNLTQMIFLLRKVLGDSVSGQPFIVTVPRQGYRFVGELTIPPAGRPRRRPLWLAAVAAGIVSISAASVWMLDRGSGQAITTIAVLPFKDTSPQKDLDYLCDGITDEVIEALSQISGLRVTARGSAFQFKNKNGDVRAVGSKLGVEAVLEGTVRYEGDYLLIEAELVSTRSGYRLWAKSYDHEAGDVFAIQRGISRSVAEALRQRVGYDLYVPRRYTADPATYDTYLKGRSALATQPIQALAFFDQALKRDPQYAPAYAGLAVAYSQMWIAGVNPDQTLPKAKEATEAALKLNDGLAEAHLAKAVLLARNWDWPGAIAETDRALRLSPSLGPALWKKGTLLLIIGREQDARSAFEYAEAIDPMAPDLFQMKIESLLGMKRFDEMIKLARQYPYAPASAYFLGKAYAEKGMMTEALEKLELHRVRGGQGYGMLTAAYVRTGRRSDALRLLDEVRETAKRRYVRASSIAAVYLALGDLDQGFRWLDRAVDEHDPTLCWLRLDSAFAPARNDPRFHSLLKKVHLDE